MRVLAAILALLLGFSGAEAQTYVNGAAQTTVANAPVQMPFVRSGDAFALPVSTTPQTYAIVQPVGAASYRGVNQCSADVMIKTVSPVGTVATQAATYSGQTVPNVQQVTSQTEAVTMFQGTLFLARTAETLGSFPNPLAGPTRYVSIMALTDPGAPCLFRLGYGNGG